MAGGVTSAEVGISSTGLGEVRGRAGLVRLLYKPVEAAEMLGIGRSKLYELLEADEIASVWIGRSRRVPVEALHAFIASRPSSGRRPKGDEPRAG
jgi:excisionase family DNA binding protein